MSNQEQHNAGQQEYTTGLLLRRFVPYYKPYIGTLLTDLGCAAMTTLRRSFSSLP